MDLLYGENCIISATTVFDRCTRVTGGQTDGRARALHTVSLYAVAR